MGLQSHFLVSYLNYFFLVASLALAGCGRGFSSSSASLESSKILPSSSGGVPAESIPVSSGKILAFPTAEGFGQNAKGGRGGTAIYVTNLNPTGPGSFKACVDSKGPRTCIFRVGGTIDYSSLAGPQLLYSLAITEPFLTIAGQTAPGDGVMIKGAEIVIKTYDVVVRYLRVRPGPDPQETNSSTGALETDGVDAHDIIFDHCSVSWAPDDMTGGWGGSSNVTYQWNIINNGLNEPSVGQFSKAMVWGGSGNDERLSVLHNLIANVQDRAPQISSGRVQMVNNVVYNVDGDANVNPYWGPILIELENNSFLRGPGSRFDLSTTIRNIGPEWDPIYNKLQPQNLAATKVYVKGNYHSTLRLNDNLPEENLVYQGGGGLPLSVLPLGMPQILSQKNAAEARSEVLRLAGARLPLRDRVDQQAVNDVINGTGQIIYTDFQSYSGGYPTYQSGTPYPDSDMDGMSDEWESANGLNPNNASDGAAVATNGYTNLENFLNKRAGDY